MLLGPNGAQGLKSLAAFVSFNTITQSQSRVDASSRAVSVKAPLRVSREKGAQRCRTSSLDARVGKTERFAWHRFVKNSAEAYCSAVCVPWNRVRAAQRITVEETMNKIDYYYYYY